MASPVSYNLAAWFNGLMEGSDFRLCLLGDSICAEGNTVCQWGLGIARTWRCPVFSGSAHRTANGTGPTGASHPYVDTPWSACNGSTGGSTLTVRQCGATYSDGTTGINPITSIDIHATGNITDATTLHRCDFGGWAAGSMDLDNWANGNPYTGGLTARVVYEAKANQIPFRLYERRNSSNTANFTSITPSTTPGVAYAERAIASATTHPGLAIVSETGVTETSGQSLHPLASCIYRGSAGSRTAGLYVSYIATGAYTTENILASLGGGGSPTVGDAYIKGFVRDAALLPNRFLHIYGQNATSAESTEYGLGGYSVYKANTANNLDRLDAIMSALGVSDHRHLLLSNYEAGTDAYNALRSQALYELSRERPNCSMASIHEVMPANPMPSLTPNPWWLHTDNVHPRATGAAMAALTLYSMGRAMKDAAVYEYRREEIRTMGA